MSTMKFTAWQDLDGNEIANAAYPPGMVLVKTQTIGSGVSSVTVNGCFSSTYQNYKVIVHGGVGSNAVIGLQLSGATAGYYGASVGSSYSTGTPYGQGDNNVSQWNYVGWAGAGTLVLVCDLFSPNLAQRTGICAGWTYYLGQSAYSTYIGETVDTTARTGFVITPASGTMTGGTIRVYGYRN